MKLKKKAPTIEDVVRWLKRGKAFLITSHKNPEADALGSQLALKIAIEKKGGRTFCFNESGVPENLKFLPGSEDIRRELPHPENFEKIIVVDSASPERITENFKELVEKKETLNIDHHFSNTNFGSLNYIDPQASATSVLIYRILKKFYPSFGKEVAENIYAGILADTGNFSFSNTNDETFQIARNLLSRGVQPNRIHRLMFASYPLRRLKLLSLALHSVEVREDLGLAMMKITGEMFEKAGAKYEDADEFVNYIRGIKGVEVAVLFKEISNGKYKLSIRTNSNQINASLLASHFGGGGHPQAAGAEVEGGYEKIKEEIIKLLQDMRR